MCFYRLSRLIIDDKTFIKNTIKKIRDWIETFEGNDQEGAQAFFFDKFGAIGRANSHIKHVNIYMARMAFGSITAYGKPLLSVTEILSLSMLLVDDDQINDLEIDNDFIKEFINMPEDHETQALKEFLKECDIRLSKRKTMCHLIAMEADIVGNY